MGVLIDVVGLARTCSQRRPRSQDGNLTGARTKIVVLLSVLRGYVV